MSGYFQILLVAACWGFMGIFVEFLATELSNFQQIFFRGLFGFLFGLIFFVSRKQKIQIPQIHRFGFYLALLGPPIAVIFYTFSILEGGIPVAIFSFYVGNLLLSALWSKFIFAEEFNFRKLLSLFILITGIAIFCWPLDQATLLNSGLIFGIIAGSISASGSAGRKLMSNKMDIVTLATMQCLVGTLIPLVVLITINEVIFPQISLFTAFTSVAYGFVSISVFILLLSAYKSINFNIAAIILSLEIVFGCFYSWLILAKAATTYQVAGSFFIILAVFVANYKPKKSS